MWMWHEVKDSKLFTFLNVLGVWINIFIIIIFVSLANGIEKTNINLAAKEIDLYTIQAFYPAGKKIKSNEFDFLNNDKRIRQAIPVLQKFGSLKVYAAIKPSDKSSMPDYIGMVSTIYAESYFTGKNKNEKDLRTESLEIIDGRKINSSDTDGIILSELIYNRLKNKKTGIDYKKWNLQIEIESDEKKKNFECRVVGIARKTPDDVIYVAYPLFTKINLFSEAIIQKQSVINTDNIREISYDRFDFVTHNLDEVESLRNTIKSKGYSTDSVIDRTYSARLMMIVVRIIFFIIIGVSSILCSFNIVITLISSVMKRQKEIGILKALGATNLQVQLIYVFHSACLCFTGSILGVLSFQLLIIGSRLLLVKNDGFKGVELLDSISIEYLFVIIFTCTSLGILSALIPSAKVTSISPIEIISRY